MHRKPRLLLTLTIISAVAALLFGFQASMAATAPAEPADTLAIDLVDFYAEFESDDAIVLTWITASEENTAGFVIRRVTGTAPPTAFNPADTIDVVDEEGQVVNYVPSDSAESGNLQGATYVVTDTNVADGDSYWYLLVEIEFDGTENDYMDYLVQAWAANATPTPTPISLSTPTPRPSATPLPQTSPTPSPTATNTPTPTATGAGTSSGNSTPTPTATSRITTTPQPTNTIGAVTGGAGGGNNTGPTPTRFTFGSGDNDTTAIAQTNPTAAYPGDGSGNAPGNDPYPAPVQESAPGEPAPTAYPESSTIQEAPPTGATTGSGVNGIGAGAYNGPDNTIGGGTNTTSEALSDATQVTEEGSQSVLLWIGFVVALLIFAAGLFGSVILFTRRRSPSSNS